MATYLQGVTDYIPEFQPFQPDLNFYANLLQTKQTQYDTNWNQLNNLYGQLYGADLTHDLNISYLQVIETSRCPGCGVAPHPKKFTLQ